MSETSRVSIEEARSLIEQALLANGVKADAAKSVAVALAGAEAEGQVGHGFSRLEDYVGQVRSGKINAGAEIAISYPTKTGLLIDADCGFAYPALDQAIELGCAAASEYGTATMSITNSHHCGALSLQVEKIANAGMIGLMMANAPKAIAPWGAKEPVFGTNPIAFAVPRPDQPPLVIDLSLSKVARGKVMNARKSGKPIPEGWALDADGNATTDPEAALAGTMVPIGGAKGTSLALMVEILAATLSGAATSYEASSFFAAEGPSPRVGQFLMAIKPHDQGGAFAVRLEALLSHIIEQDGARLPGTRRLAALKDARENGISVPSHYLELARRLAG